MSELAAFLDQGWALLCAGASRSDHPMSQVALATVAEGQPQARYVVLRDADRAGGWLEVHTDLVTAKVAQVRERPGAAILAWSPEDRVQVRATGRMTVRSGPDIAHLWDRVPPSSRVSYGTRPKPGTPIPDAHDYDKPADPERFAVLRLTIDSLELLHLPERHRRARFDRADGFAGTWLAP